MTLGYTFFFYSFFWDTQYSNHISRFRFRIIYFKFLYHLQICDFYWADVKPTNRKDEQKRHERCVVCYSHLAALRNTDPGLFIFYWIFCSLLSTHRFAVFPVDRPGVSVAVISRPVGLDSVLIVVVRRVIVLGMVRMLGTAGHWNKTTASVKYHEY